MRRFWSNYIFLLVPFVVLIITKLIISKPEELLLSTDWSIASFMIVAQSMSLIVSDNFKGEKLDSSGVIIFLGITIIFLVLCIGSYAYAIIKSNCLSGIIQILLFFGSSLWMCGIYKASDYIKKATSDKN